MVWGIDLWRPLNQVKNKRQPLSTPFYLFLINGLTLCGGFIFFIIISLRTLEQTAVTQTIENLRTFAYAIEQVIQNHQLTQEQNQEILYQSIDKLVRETAAHDTGFRITVINRQGTVVGDSDAQLSSLGNHLNRHEVQEALAGREAFDIRESSVYKEVQIYYAIPLNLQNKPFVLRLAIPMKRNVFFSSNVRQDSIFSMVLVLSTILIVTFVIAAKILRPLNELKETARHYEEGNFDYKPAVHTPREFQELAENLDSMGKTIQQNILDLSQSRDELKRLERVRKDFVANVSHELKTPVTVITGFIETLQDGAIQDQETANYFLEIMAQQSYRLNNIIDDLLALSRLEQAGAKIETQPVNVVDIITDVLAGQSFLAQSKSISMTYNILPATEVIHLTANPGLMSQALGNIVNNSVKYCPAGSQLHIQVQKMQSEEGATLVQIVIEDTGHGIPEQYQQRIFERFFRVDKGRSRDTGGTGLGLSIVHHIIQLHGGKIRACNRTDGNPGARFEIELPGV